jgi:hypothetical protein
MLMMPSTVKQDEKGEVEGDWNGSKEDAIMRRVSKVNGFMVSDAIT